MKPYPKYKPSGVEWIGEIPQEWEAKKLKYNDVVIMGQSPNSDDYNQSGLGFPFLQGNADFGLINPDPQVWCETANKVSIPNDILLSVRAPIGAVNLSNREYGIGRGLCAIRSTKSDFKYLYYQILRLHDELNSIGTGSTYTAISVDEVENLFCIFPPLAEQTAIAYFLNRKTVQIDDFIAKKQKLIELLREERTAVINHAVTKGIDPKSKMKSSGIEWLGSIPEHWVAKKLKYEVRFYNHIRVPLSSEERGLMTDKKYDYYGASGIIDKVENYLFDGDYILVGEDGANLVTRSTPLAFIARGKYWVNNHAHILRPMTGNIEYFTHLLEIKDYSIFITGSAQPKLTLENLGDIEIVIPPIDEQDRIVSFIESETAKIDRTIATIEKEIALIQEYRTALISEAVTGKIDVRS